MTEIADKKQDWQPPEEFKIFLGKFNEIEAKLKDLREDETDKKVLLYGELEIEAKKFIAEHFKKSINK